MSSNDSSNDDYEWFILYMLDMLPIVLTYIVFTGDEKIIELYKKLIDFLLDKRTLATLVIKAWETRRRGGDMGSITRRLTQGLENVDEASIEELRRILASESN
ncbi:MAG: hypothetical protein C0179_07330 [Fervidicoccus sp.]|nr:MAG: hypothetical protein C0179_07330 [Fervidicoccus sp.]